MTTLKNNALCINRNPEITVVVLNVAVAIVDIAAIFDVVTVVDVEAIFDVVTVVDVATVVDV